MPRPTHQFSQTKTAEIPRSSFDLSHGLKTTIEASRLYPILVLETLPGDTISCRASLFGRLATPLKPFLDNLYLETFFFWSATRNLWENWEKFNGEQDAPGDSTDYVVPIFGQTTPSVAEEGKLADYMGIPPGTSSETLKINSLPFRMYGEVYNFWFRDQNLVDPMKVNKGDGPDSGNTSVSMNATPRARRKRRDYLTSALPWPQKAPDVVVPLGDKAEIHHGGNIADPMNVYADGAAAYKYLYDATAGPANIQVGPTTDPEAPNARTLYADLANATSVTINALRESIQIQKLFERDARGGTRYPEILASHFRVRDPSLLVHQRPVFLGGGSSRININPVQQTAPQQATGTVTPQGNLAAFGTVSGGGHGFTTSCTEHGYILGLVNVRADLTYQQGLERMWSRQTRFDYYWPALSHLGEQAILNKEIFVSNNATADEGVFGYIPRYDEYRFKQSNITGLMRSAAQASLDVWHLAQDFATLPTLSKEFIEDNVPMDRVSAVQSEPSLLLDVFFKIRAARPLPLYATPGLMDHF